jgi:hypothetical protein
MFQGEGYQAVFFSLARDEVERSYFALIIC